jgi:hypothetical protein
MKLPRRLQMASQPTTPNSAPTTQSESPYTKLSEIAKEKVLGEFKKIQDEDRERAKKKKKDPAPKS